jgi:xylulokinase
MRNSPAILTIDVGLTNCKSTVFSQDARNLGKSSVEYPTYFPKEGYIEQDPHEWWLAVRQATNKLWDQHPNLASRIACISVTGHMHSLTSLDKHGQPIGRSIILGDQRSIGVAAHINNELGLSEVYRIIGTRMDASMPAAKILWLKEQAPEIFNEAQLFLSCKDFIRTLLVGEHVTDPIDACGMALYDIHINSWSEEMLRIVGIDTYKLPQIADSIDVVGKLGKEPAQELGLMPGIPVVVGAGDDIEVLGYGLIEPGQALEHIGTTGSILACADKVPEDPLQSLEVYPHAVSGLWVVGGSITAAGSAISWASDLMGYRGVESAISTLITPHTPKQAHPLIFIPHLLGERTPSWIPRARGAWIGLTPAHTRACQPYESDEWLKLRSNIYSRQIAIVEKPDPTALGAMMLAAISMGLFESKLEAVNKLIRIERIIKPDADNIKLYASLFNFYQNSQSALHPLWVSL